MSAINIAHCTENSVQISSQTVFLCSHCSVQLVESQGGNTIDLKIGEILLLVSGKKLLNKIKGYKIFLNR